MASGLCATAVVRSALQRLVGTFRRDKASKNVSNKRKEYEKLGRSERSIKLGQAGRKTVVAMAEFFAIIAGVGFLCWICYALSREEAPGGKYSKMSIARRDRRAIKKARVSKLD